MDRRKGARFLIGLLIIGALVGAGYGASLAVKEPASGAAVNRVSDVAMVPGNFSELAEKVRPGVVNIRVTKTVKGVSHGLPPFFGNPFGDFFGPFSDSPPSGRFEQRGLGTGFVISRDGYIITNNHVVEQADGILVKLADGKELAAKIMGRDPKTDLALIRIEGVPNLHPLDLGNSDDLKVGNWVIAVGNPFGLEQTVTAGIVSGKGRVIGAGPYDNFIQTDASINPGNSGGPLINLRGEVVGINTAIIASGQGIGFAIPVNMAKDIVPQLQDRGHVTRGWLGVSIQEVTPQLARSFGLKDTRGALIAETVSGSPADKAGIRQGDVILEFHGKEVRESRDLSRIVASTPTGATVTVKLWREGSAMTLQVKVGEMEEKAEIAQAPSHKSLGLNVQNITPETAGSLGLRNEAGVVVTGVQPGSPAAEAGIQRGDLIREVDRRPVRSVEEFVGMVAKAKDQESVLLLLQRGRGRLYAAVTPK